MIYQLVAKIHSPSFPDELLSDILSAGHPGPLEPTIEFYGSYYVTLVVQWDDSDVREDLEMAEFALKVEGLVRMWEDEYSKRPVAMSVFFAEANDEPTPAYEAGLITWTVKASMNIENRQKGE